MKQFGQPPDNEVDLVNWRKDIQDRVDAIADMTIPDDADGTLADVTTKVNELFAALRLLE
jgi:hypothetical protein